MPIYECGEQQFMNNLKRVVDNYIRIVVNRCVLQYDDGRYALTHLPDYEFIKYKRLADRDGPRSAVYATKPFMDDLHRKFHPQGSVVCSLGRNRPSGLAVPYMRVEHSFTLWGETYVYSYDVLCEPSVKLERRVLPKSVTLESEERKPQLMHTLNFKPPPEETSRLGLPNSVMVMDVRKVIRPHGTVW